MNLLEVLKDWFRHEASKYLYHPIPFDHVRDPKYKDETAAAGARYFRLWLSEMGLERDRDWFTSWHPAVHSLVRFQFGSETVDVPHVAGSSQIPQINGANLDRMIPLNYALTTLMPYNGGVVELEAGLLAMQGTNSLQSFLKVLGDFSSLLNVPQLSAALVVAGPVATGVQELLGSTNGQLHLGLHQTYATKSGGAAELRPGYIAVVLTEARKPLDPNRLFVVNDRLCVGSSLDDNQLLTGYTHMLLRIETRPERDDLEGLTSIETPFRQAKEALGRSGFKMTDEVKSLLCTAMTVAYTSSDLTKADRISVAKSMKAELEDMVGQGAVEIAKTKLADTVQRFGEKPETVLRGPQISLAELVRDFM
jgi:hypothetical protein